LKIRKSSRTEFGKAFGGGVEPYLRGVGHAKTRRDLSLTLFAQDDNVVAQKAEEGFLSRRQERGRKYGAHGGLGMTNRGGLRPARRGVGIGKDPHVKTTCGAPGNPEKADPSSFAHMKTCGRTSS